MYACVYVYTGAYMHERFLDRLTEKKNKPPLIHVFLLGTTRRVSVWSTAILSQDQDLEDAHPPLVAPYTKLLRLKLGGIKDTGFEIEDSTDDSFRGLLPMQRDASCVTI